MVAPNTKRWGSLENWSGTLFLVAGVLFLGGAAVNGLIFFGGVAISEVVSVGLLLIGLASVLIGLSGLYPRLSERASRLAKISLAAITVAAVGVFVLLAWAVVMIVGVSSEPSPIVAIGTLLLLIVGLLLFGVTVLHTGVYPRSVGILLLAEVAALVLVFVVPQLLYEGDAPRSFAVGIEGAQALILLATGYLLRTETGPSDRSESAPDTTVR